MKKLPNFIIIGAMKCATSSLHEQLALQPGIFMSELKEPNFFSNDSEYEKGMEWYLSLFTDASPQDLCGESSTHYSKLPTYPYTVERLHKHLPNAKLIYVMRHPIDRFISQYIHEWTQRVISVEINQAISQHRELINYSLYTQQLRPYLAAYGQDNVLPVFFERILTYPQAELERICQFIGYFGQPQWQEELEAQNISGERMRHSRWRDVLVKASEFKQFRQRMVPKSFRDWIRNLWTIKKKPELTLKNQEYLQNIFDEDLAILGSWLGMELSCNTFKETAKVSSANWIKSIVF